MSGGNQPQTCSCCRQEFQLSRCGLQYPDPEVFISSQWKRHSFAYALYRALSALCLLTMFVVSWIHHAPKDGWSQLSFLTEWSYDVLTCSFILRAALTCFAYKKQYKSGFCPVFLEMHWSLKLSWVLYNVSSCAALSLSLFYWAVLFNPEKNENTLEWILDIHRHVLQSLIVLVDLSISAVPIHLLHILHTWIYGIVYLFFNIAYVMISPGNRPVYKYLDWKNSTGLAIGISLGFASVVMTTVWVCLFGLFKLRLYLYTATLRPGKEPVSKDKYTPERQISYQQNMDVGLISETSLN